jgi:hypothetical protein
MNIGHMIGSGQYGQSLQGGLLMVTGGFIVATSLVTAVGVHSGITGPTALMYLSGGAALAALAGAYLTTPTSYPPGTFANNQPPDWSLFGGSSGQITPSGGSGGGDGGGNTNTNPNPNPNPNNGQGQGTRYCGRDESPADGCITCVGRLDTDHNTCSPP